MDLTKQPEVLSENLTNKKALSKNGQPMRTVARMQSQSSMAPAIRRSLILVMVMAAALMNQSAQFGLCNRLQDEQQRTIDQMHAIYGGRYSDYSSLIGDNLMQGVSHQQPLYLAGKRARKISGFMPMRGRKDGRDEQQQQQQPQIYVPLQQSEEIIATPEPFRDNDGELSILRIVAAGERNPVGGGSASDWPRQFVNQVALQHLMADAGNRAATLRRTATQADSLSGDSGGALIVGGDSIMQAKLRRAFHPMRGKKSFGANLLAADQSGFADDLLDTN